MKIFIAIVILGCAQVLLAAPPKTIPPKATITPKNDLPAVDELINTLKTQFNEVSQKVNEALGIKSNDDAIKQIQKHANDFATEINKFVTTISAEATKHEPEIKKAVKAYQDVLSGVIDKFKKDSAELGQSAQKVQTSLQETVNKVIEESKKLEKNLEQDTSGLRAEINKFTKDAIDKAINGAKELQQKLADPIKKDAKKP